MEQEEIVEFFRSPAGKDVHTFRDIEVQQKGQTDFRMTKVINVFGEKGEPICDYRRCNHKFSIHGLGTPVCRCRHPQNTGAGVLNIFSSR
jgi:hypothetical protein